MFPIFLWLYVISYLSLEFQWHVSLVPFINSCFYDRHYVRFCFPYGSFERIYHFTVIRVHWYSLCILHHYCYIIFLPYFLIVKGILLYFSFLVVLLRFMIGFPNKWISYALCKLVHACLVFPFGYITTCFTLLLELYEFTL